MREFVIGQNDAGQRADKFLSKAVPRLPQALLQKYLRMKRIKLNGRRCEAACRLAVGDVMSLYINDEFFEDSGALPFLFAPAQVDIVYEDEDILIANKPAGLIVHEDAEEKYDTLINRICRLLYERGEYDPAKENSFAPALCNRIDRGTCGMVIAAKNAGALRVLNEKIRLREIDKYYLCVTAGHLSPKEGRLSGYLLKDGENNRVRAVGSRVEGARTAVTEYRVLKSMPDRDLVEARLITGRTHQIRAQLAQAGAPLLGDSKYGRAASAGGYRNQALCAYRMVFRFAPGGDAGPLERLNGREFRIDTGAFLERYGAK